MSAYKSPRELAEEVLDGLLLDNRNEREKIKLRLIEAIKNRDSYWMKSNAEYWRKPKTG